MPSSPAASSVQGTAAALLASTVCVALLYAVAARASSPSLRHVMRRRDDVAARRSVVSQAYSPPPRFAWTSVSVDDARLWTMRFAGSSTSVLAPGSYATRVQDQHRSQWCGACYLLAVVHMVQDRWHVRLGQHPSVTRMNPWVELDAQLMLDDYDAHRGAMHAGWNACQGGDPMRVLACMESGECPLHIADGDGYAWLGHPRRRTDGQPRRVRFEDEEPASRVRVRNIRRVRNTADDVKRCIYERGTAVLTIDAECLIRADGRGVAETTERRRRNHAVSVVGWEEGVVDDAGRNRGCCYIVRNTWGKESVPSSLPEDVKCVQRGSNACDVDKTRWTGIPSMPGFVYLPQEYVHGDAGESPWSECDVVVVEAQDAR